MGQTVLDVIAHLAPFRKRYLNKELMEECGEANVLCLQEILSGDSQRFFDSLVRKYFPFAIRDNNKFKLISLRGSGLGVGTRIKQSVAKFLPFKSRGVSWDRYARKGALYTQLEFEGKTIDLITAHLQAGYSAESRLVRAQQLAELRNWVIELGSPDRHFIVCGDFNIQGLAETREAGEYKTLTTMLDGFTDLGAESDLATYHPHPEGNPLAHAFEKETTAQRIDYIFVRPAVRAAEIVCSGFKRFFDKPVASLGNGISSWASDHYGLKATFEI
jgi:endonuclease/exonuclease/phosphatase family metal-dependent hydrolase